jgi:hypothetical protein
MTTPNLEPKAPSCTDLDPSLSHEDKRRALLWFEFISIIDHAHHAMNKAMQDFFIELSFEVEWLATEFSYADELAADAKRKRMKKEMIFGIISALLLTASAVTGIVAMWAEPIVQAASQSAKWIHLGEQAAKFSSTVQKAAKAIKLPGKEGAEYGQGMATQLSNLNSAVGGIIGGGW